MATIKFDRCLFQILAGLASSELNALCNYINSKIDIIQAEVNKALAISGAFEGQINLIEGQVRTALALFDKQTASSALLAAVKAASPECVEISDIFQGALEAGSFTATVVTDAIITLRQIDNFKGLALTLRNEALDQIDALRSVCTIVQLIIQKKGAEELDKYLGGKIPPIKVPRVSLPRSP